MTKLDADCYEVLQLVKETATASDIKKAYRTLALKYHPDKLVNATEEDKEKANEKFQQLGFAYAILSDPQRKKRYDKTGSTDESFFESEKDWTAYFKELWSGVVSAETIEEFKKKYQGSAEERRDVYKAYNDFDGDMDKVLEVIECSEAKDTERFVVMLEEGIANSELTLLERFKKSITKEAHEKRLKQAEKESKKSKAKDKKQKKRQKQPEDIGSLALLIQQKNQDRARKMDDFFEAMEKKALQGQTSEDEQVEKQGDLPTDEEFNKIQERLMKRKSTFQDSKKSSKKQKQEKA